MNADLVCRLYQLLKDHGVQLWIDGGWGVDALLERQTRPHSDLDIAVEAHDVPQLRAVLAERGFSEIACSDATPWMFVLGDGDGNRVDVHAVVFDTEGRGVLGPPELGHVYPAGALDGRGAVDGVSVRCVSAEALVKFKTSFEQRIIDRADVAVLCERFGIPPPRS